jgi:hypothetical protein
VSHHATAGASHEQRKQSSVHPRPDGRLGNAVGLFWRFLAPPHIPFDFRRN